MEGKKAKDGSVMKWWLVLIINVAAMIVIGLVLLFITMRWIRSYTNHGEYIQVPPVQGMMESEAAQTLAAKTLTYEINDVRYDASLPTGAIIEQNPRADANVKEGRTIYLTVNSGNEPQKAVPDLADNSSLRAAQAQLLAAGFKLGSTEYIDGDQDWVYEIKYNGSSIEAGTMIPEGSTLTIVAGNGTQIIEIAEADSTEEIVDYDFFDSEL